MVCKSQPQIETPNIAYSSLGSCLVSWIENGRHVLVALQSYFDGSYAGSGWREGNWVTLAGFAAEDIIWIDFDKNWNDILHDDSQRPRAEFLHMKEAAHLSGSFSWKHGWNLKKVYSLVMDLLMYVQTVDKKRLRQFACSIDLNAYRKLLGQGFQIPDPIEICNGHCPEGVLVWYLGEHPGIISAAHYFFDQSEPFKDPFEQRWKNEKAKTLSLRPTAHYWEIVKTVTTADMKDKPALQSADLLAWASNRVLNAQKDSFGVALEHIMKQIIPSSWVVFDETRFRQELSKPKPCWELTDF